MAQTVYRYLFADLLTNDILAELPLTGVTFTQALNQAGTLNAHLLISDAREGAYDIQGSTIPGRTALYVERDNVLVWGGIIWLRTYNADKQTLDFSAREFESYFERRRIAVSQAYNNTDQLTVVESLVNNAQSATNGNIGIIVGSETSSVLVTRVYYQYELKNLFEAIKDLATSSEGFDFNIDVYYDSSLNPRKILRLDYPYRGTPYSSTSPTALVFEFPGNIIAYDYPEDASITANLLWGVGPGSNEGKLLAEADIPGQWAAGWPLLEDATNYADVYDPALLSNLTSAEVTAKQNPVTSMKIVLSGPQDDPPLGSFKTGDQCLVRITDSRFPNNGSGYGLVVIKRIIAINVEAGENGPERITLTLNDPPPA